VPPPAAPSRPRRPPLRAPEAALNSEHGPAPDEHATLGALADLRPALTSAYRRALPGARAAVLGRLWGGLAREPLEGVHRREVTGGTLTLVLAGGQRLSGPAGAAEPFAEPPECLHLDGTPHGHPARLLEALALPGARERLVVELDNSVANLALARAAHRPAPDRDLADAEQSLVDGHPLHPCCRTRIGMSTADVLRYAPEHRPTVHLHVVAVRPEHWHTTGEARPPLLPVHPWQLDRVLATGFATDTGATIAARPLMSLRTLAPVDDPAVHLKTAVEVQMTSAVRTLSAPAIHNGPLAAALVADLARRTRGLTVLRERTGAAVLVDGEPRRTMAAVWRDAPPAGRTILPLAALPERRHLLTPAFVTALAELMLPPLLTLLHLGVALEAHGQNTLVELDGGRPVRLYYRDVGGIHVSPRRLARAGVEPPPLTGALPTDDPDRLRTKLFAAAVSTVLASIVDAGAAAGASWDPIAVTARRVFAELPDTGDRRAFFADTLPLKATTAMRLAEQPLDDLWTALPNPLR
jgi:staphyloferrin A synthase